jgi:hypothetical protein
MKCQIPPLLANLKLPRKWLPNLHGILSSQSMWRLLLLISAASIAAALILRWWFGTRILASMGSQVCRCDLNRWLPAPGDTAVIHRAEETADEFGRQLRLKAIAEWHQQDPKTAASRERSRRFGIAVPPLSGLVAVFAALVPKIPIIGAISIFLAATALACVTGLLSLAPELRAIARAAGRVHKDRCFSRSEEEEAVLACAMAHAWKEALPPVLNLLNR